MYKVVINDNYLCHFNQNHSKKNGQFTSGDGDGDGIVNDHAHRKKVAFGGKSKDEYTKSMYSKYRKEGYNKLDAKNYARFAANQNKLYTDYHNKSIDRAKKFHDKAQAEKKVGNMKAYKQYTDKMLAAYRDAKINAGMIDRAYDLGRSIVQEAGLMALGGAPAFTIYNNTNKNSTEAIRRQVTEEVDRKH